MPAPSAAAPFAAPLASVILRSATSTVVELTVVVVPVTCKLPAITTVPPTPAVLGSMLITAFVLLIELPLIVISPAVNVVYVPIAVAPIAPV